MTVQDLIEKLITLPKDATIKVWDISRDSETDDVAVSITTDGDVFITDTCIGNYV